jgi:RND family efflux transporter MFP subunit
MHIRRSTALSASFLAISISGILMSTLMTGCARNEAATPNVMPAVEVGVAEVISKPVTDFDQYTGRIAATQRVQVRPRVSGFISSVNFSEGREVKQGEILFVIDPRPYDAELKRAQAQLQHDITAANLAKIERDRAEKLLAQTAISQEQFDMRVTGSEQAQANVLASQAAVDTAQLNVSFTQVRAPITGRVGKAEITAGNLVANGTTLLTTIVSQDPVYVEFQADEQTYLKHARQDDKSVKKTKAQAQAVAEANSLWVGLADEAGYPHQATLEFVDNELDSATGAIHIRGVLNNSDRKFIPGMFARVKFPQSSHHDAILIRDAAIGTDQNVRFVFVVNAENKIEYRAIKPGTLIDDLREVDEGLKPGERIVVNGLQRVRPGATVAPQQVAMQTEHANHNTLLASTGATQSGVK